MQRHPAPHEDPQTGRRSLRLHGSEQGLCRPLTSVEQGAVHLRWMTALRCRPGQGPPGAAGKPGILWERGLRSAVRSVSPGLIPPPCGQSGLGCEWGAPPTQPSSQVPGAVDGLWSSLGRPWLRTQPGANSPYTSSSTGSFKDGLLRPGREAGLHARARGQARRTWFSASPGCSPAWLAPLCPPRRGAPLLPVGRITDMLSPHNKDACWELQSKKERPEIPGTEGHAGEKPKLATEELAQVPKQAQAEGLQISVRKEVVQALPGEDTNWRQKTAMTRIVMTSPSKMEICHGSPETGKAELKSTPYYYLCV